MTPSKSGHQNCTNPHAFVCCCCDGPCLCRAPASRKHAANPPARMPATRACPPQPLVVPTRRSAYARRSTREMSNRAF
eukprot:2187890-Alexandrium_andersonii.AAC.1